MAIDSIAAQGVVKEDMVEAFWVVKDENDDRGGTYPLTCGIIVPSWNNLMFTTDRDWRIEENYQEHLGENGIRLANMVHLPAEVVSHIANLGRIRNSLNQWLSQFQKNPGSRLKKTV